MPGSVACHDKKDHGGGESGRDAGAFSLSIGRPKIAQVNDYDVRIVKLRGEFTWHRHADTGEFFLVLGGRLTNQMPDRDAMRGRGSCSSSRVVSNTVRGPMPRPRCFYSSRARSSTPGDAGGELTAEVEELA
jgi:hypothetical protein